MAEMHGSNENPGVLARLRQGEGAREHHRSVGSPIWPSARPVDGSVGPATELT